MQKHTGALLLGPFELSVCRYKKVIFISLTKSAERMSIFDGMGITMYPSKSKKLRWVSTVPFHISDFSI